MLKNKVIKFAKAQLKNQIGPKQLKVTNFRVCHHSDHVIHFHVSLETRQWENYHCPVSYNLNTDKLEEI